MGTDEKFLQNLGRDSEFGTIGVYNWVLEGELRADAGAQHPVRDASVVNDTHAGDLMLGKEVKKDSKPRCQAACGQTPAPGSHEGAATPPPLTAAQPPQRPPREPPPPPLRGGAT